MIKAARARWGARMLTVATGFIVWQAASPLQPAQAAGTHATPRLQNIKISSGFDTLTSPLSPQDEARYRQIFAALDAGNTYRVGPLMAGIQNRLLEGHVLAMSFIAPGYRPSYDELVDWLQRFGDLPEAGAVYQTALEQRPRGAARPPAPASNTLDNTVSTNSGAYLPGPLDSSDREVRASFSAGLSQWRAHDYAGASRIFTAMAERTDLGGEERAAAAVWAARADMRTGRPQSVVKLLDIAVGASQDFYGIVAQSLLGGPVLSPAGAAGLPGGTGNVLATLANEPGAQRAVALAQVGLSDLADEELRSLAARLSSERAPAVAALAEKLELPGARMRVNQAALANVSVRPDPAAFPMPDFAPDSGFSVNRALIFAIMRAESGFRPDAGSRAGARGLMQLMPATARSVAQWAGISYRGVRSLRDPGKNLDLGQAYLQRLVESPSAGTSLIHLIAAYNAGDGAVGNWMDGQLADAGDDPLLFIEDIPYSETRQYVKKVLLNLWAYSEQMGQPNPSLRALAENRWPDVMITQPTMPEMAGYNGGGGYKVQNVTATVRSYR